VAIDPNNSEYSHGLNKARAGLGETAAVTETPQEAPPAFADQLEPAPAQIELDEETQAYFNSTITDIDLFSSYGMTDKALELAKQLLERLPQHPQANEKVLDLFIATSNGPGVVEVARRLEHYHREMGSFQRAEELRQLGAQYGHAPAAAAPAPEAPATAEVVPEAPVEAAPVQAPAADEIDLSAEWMAAAAPEEAEPAPAAAEVFAAPPPAEPEPGPEPAVFNAKEATEEIEFYLNQGMLDMARDVVGRYEGEFPGEGAVTELRARVEAAASAPAPAVEEPPAAAEPVAPLGAEAAEGETYDLVLEEQPKAEPAAAGAMTADSFFSDLAGELDEALAEKKAPPPARGKG
ncbi:MAG: hypothetical protein ACREKB_07285, partial [Candidatus Rokuibacteriota bacterium]